MNYIIIDTSSIIFGLSNKVDVFKAVKHHLGMSPVISRGVVRELATISMGQSKERKYAGVALELMARHEVKVENNNTYVDGWIIKNAPKYRNVLTNDVKLKEQLKAKKVSVYTVSIGGKIK